MKNYPKQRTINQEYSYGSGYAYASTMCIASGFGDGLGYGGEDDYYFFWGQENNIRTHVHNLNFLIQYW